MSTQPTNPWDVQGGWTPANRQELVDYAGAKGWSEDFQRFTDEAGVQDWINNYWDPNARKFRSAKTDMQGNALQGFVEKPDETPQGWAAWGQHAIQTSDPAYQASQGGGGGWGGGGGMGGPYGGYNPGGGYGPGSGRTFGTFGGAPQFQWDKFVAPNPQDIVNDPSYQFRLQEGNKAIQGSAAAKGLLRSGGTLKDLAGYGQDLASQEIGNQFNRALQGWGANYQGGKDAFAPAYGSWENMQNQALQKYLQREGNIFGLINSPAPMAPGY